MPRRILLLITDLQIGGTPTVVRELAIRLHDPPDTIVEVACLKGWGPVANQIRNAGIKVTAFGARNVLSLPKTLRLLRRLVQSRGFDTVVSFLVHSNAVAAAALWRLTSVGANVRSIRHGSLREGEAPAEPILSPTLPARQEPRPPEVLKRTHCRLIQSIQTTQEIPRWHWWLQGKVQSKAERLIVPSHAIVKVAKERSGIPEDRFVVIPNAIDPDPFPRTPVFAGPGEMVRVGFLGRIDPVKRIHLALDAVRQITDFPAELHVFGAGGAAIVDPTSHTLRWRGPVTRPQDALSQMDVLILPSIGEGFGLVLIEAMAAGVPVVASEAGAIPEVVRHEETGLLVPVGPNEAAGFAEAIRRLRTDVALRERLITNGLACVREKYTWDIVLPQYRQVLGI